MAIKPISAYQASQPSPSSATEAPQPRAKGQALLKKRSFGFNLGKFGIHYSSQDVVEVSNASSAKAASDQTAAQTSAAALPLSAAAGTAATAPAASIPSGDDADKSPLTRRLGLRSYTKTAAQSDSPSQPRTPLAVA